MSRGALNRMLVEGQEDKFSIIQLMKHHIDWPEDKSLYPVTIELGGSAEEILARGFLTTKLKSSEVDILGVVLDADDNCDERWNRLRALCIGLFPAMPAILPATGLIVDNDDGKRFGAWIMPDNLSRGMLETFLRFLVPEMSEPILLHAKASLSTAREKGAACRECHVDKALIHTWLAWQDPPGESFGRALTRKILDPHAAAAKPFVKWFSSLYRI
jgi:hypothetical protein